MENKSRQCRVCLKHEKARKLQPLFSKSSNINAERIFMISGIQIDDDYKELLPDQICFKCSDALMCATQIRSLCLESHKLLMKQLSDLNLLKTEKVDKIEETQELLVVNEDCDENLQEVHLEGEDPRDDDSEADDELIDNTKDEIHDEEFYIQKTTAMKRVRNPSNKLQVRNSYEICEQCGKRYTKHYIAQHLRTHLDSEEKEKKYRCDNCGLNFNLKSYLYSHMICVHAIAKKWTCSERKDDGSICGKSYAKKHTYMCHLRNHSENGRIFICTFENCNKSFTQQNKLSVHQRIHTNERPYTCSFCGRGFIHFTDHKRHVMGHTGERPYKCNQPNCQRGFIKKSELTAHEKTHRS